MKTASQALPLGVNLAVGLLSLCIMQVAGRACAADRVGKVCIPSIPMGERWNANDTGAKDTSTFTIQLDELAPVLVATNASGTFTNLVRAGEHSLSIRLDGKHLSSFRFSFRDRGHHLR